jgi:hypothetical protein
MAEKVTKKLDKIQQGILKWIRGIYKRKAWVDFETQPLSPGKYIIGCDFANGKDQITIIQIKDGQVKIIK